MFELQNVTKTYKAKRQRNRVLNDVSFRFPKGKNVAIMGNNGAGKSTLMRLLAGIEQPDRGRIFREGRTSWPMGFSGGFNGSMTGLENVRFVSRLYGQDTERVTDYVCSFADLGDALRMPIRTYSSGMKARLAFGLSMAIDFNCYLVDEITAVGDKSFRTRCREAFDEKLSKASLVMISHSTSTIREYCDCGILLHNGEITYFPNIEDLICVYQEDARV
jgi:capsular polysaccharide transport system ATP-binding protein